VRKRFRRQGIRGSKARASLALRRESQGEKEVRRRGRAVLSGRVMDKKTWGNLENIFVLTGKRKMTRKKNQGEKTRPGWHLSP